MLVYFQSKAIVFIGDAHYARINNNWLWGLVYTTVLYFALKTYKTTRKKERKAPLIKNYKWKSKRKTYGRENPIINWNAKNRHRIRTCEAKDHLAGQPVNHSGTVTFKSGNYRLRVLVVYTEKLARDRFGQILMFLLVRFEILRWGKRVAKGVIKCFTNLFQF